MAVYFTHVTGKEINHGKSDLKLDTPHPPNPLAPVVRFVFGMCMRSQSMEMMGCHGNNLKLLSPFPAGWCSMSGISKAMHHHK